MNILPDAAFLELEPGLSERMLRIGASIHAEEFSALADPLMREIFHSGVSEAGAHEGTVWLVDEGGEFLVPAVNTGPRAGEMVGHFRQPLKSGLICMVFDSEQPFLENEVSNNPGQSKLLDSKLGVRTTALIAVPFYFLRNCRGVISCVQLEGPGYDSAGSTGFRPQHLKIMQHTASVLAQLIEYQLLSCAVGWKNS